MERHMILIRTDGTGRLIRCDDGDTCKLETLQQLVGGLIETADSCLEPGWAREPVDSIKLIVNEEGLLQELPVNWKAMNLYQYGYMSGIVGTAVLAAARGDELMALQSRCARPSAPSGASDWEVKRHDRPEQCPGGAAGADHHRAGGVTDAGSEDPGDPYADPILEAAGAVPGLRVPGQGSGGGHRDVAVCAFRTAERQPAVAQR